MITEIYTSPCIQVLSAMVGLHIPKEQVLYLQLKMVAGVTLDILSFFPCTQLSSIVRRTIKEADKDKDNYINLEEFKQVCKGVVW